MHCSLVLALIDPCTAHNIAHRSILALLTHFVLSLVDPCTAHTCSCVDPFSEFKIDPCTAHTDRQKTYSTRTSRVVPHHSTTQAQQCLASEFGWDLACSPWYDCMTMIERSCHVDREQHQAKRKSSGTGNRTLGVRVTGGNVTNYTMPDGTYSTQSSRVVPHHSTT